MHLIDRWILDYIHGYMCIIYHIYRCIVSYSESLCIVQIFGFSVSVFVFLGGPTGTYRSTAEFPAENGARLTQPVGTGRVFES